MKKLTARRHAKMYSSVFRERFAFLEGNLEHEILSVYMCMSLCLCAHASIYNDVFFFYHAAISQEPTNSNFRAV